MKAENLEMACAMLCLLTKAAWQEGLPAPLSRVCVRELLEQGKLHGLHLRDQDEWPPVLLARAQKLLSRASAVYACIAALEKEGWTILLSSDRSWPKNLEKLGAQMPLFLFKKGNTGLLGRVCVSVAGSRTIKQKTKQRADEIGAKIARMNKVLVSGAAKGVDTYSLAGCLFHGGKAIVVPAMPAGTLLRNEYIDAALKERRLLFLCETLPDEPFTAQKALTRNHTIYALGDKAVVVASRIGRGGSWSGANACLKGGWTPVFAVYEEDEDCRGNLILVERGAHPLTPQRITQLKRTLFSKNVIVSPISETPKTSEDFSEETDGLRFSQEREEDA